MKESLAWGRERDRLEREAERRHQAAKGHPFPESVYYVRIGTHVKIGTSKDLPQRLRSFYVDHNPELLLAVEPGGLGMEATRHAQFKDERVWANRELFNPSRRLLAHIKAIRDEHGIPSLAA